MGGFAGELRQVEPHALAPSLPRQGQQRLAQVGHAFDLLLHYAQGLFRGGKPLMLRIELQTYGGQGGTQLMGGVAGELGLALAEGREPFEHLVEGLAQVAKLPAALGRHPQAQVARVGHAPGSLL